MCGITGIWSPSGLPDEATLRERLTRMAATLRHRGPDASGVWSDESVGLGHTRLSIIDLSAAGHQPMSTDDGDLHIVFNGEIYNFPALRAELTALGHRFASRSDTEVILLGYRQWGVGVLERLRGMFAFVLWDARRRELFLARDRVGKKPLYYGWVRNRLVFGSEIKAILAWPETERIPNYEAIHHYLSFRYVPDAMTAFAGIYALKPAHYMIVRADGSTHTEQYWSLPHPPQTSVRSLRDIREELIERLDEAVRVRLLADVPVGAFLSGGVDSGSVVASMARVAEGRIRTFTVGFSEASADERADARLIAERYGTDHSDFVVTPKVADVLPKIVWHYGEPFADPVAIPSYYLSEITRQHVTVALNGDGGDENFFGYRRHAGARIGAWLDKLPLAVRKKVAAAGRLLPLENATRGFPVQLRHFMLAADQSRAARYGSWVTYFSDDLKAELYADTMKPELEGRSTALLDRWFSNGASPEDCAARADIHTFLPDDLLVRIVVATMAHGLEGRSPFLDQEFMTFAASIPSSQKMTGIRTKSLLRAAMEDRLPRRILYGPKRGFPMPLRGVIDDLREMIHDVLLSDTMASRGLFRPTRVRSLLDDHYNGSRSRPHEIWALLMLELWFGAWIDRTTDGPQHELAVSAQTDISK